MRVVRIVQAIGRTALSVPCMIGSMLLISQAVQAQETLVELNDVRSDEILTVGFELTDPMTVTIEALGLSNYDGNNLAAYSWILDHDSRDLVWVQERRYRIKSRSRGAQVETSEEITLDAGKYELYLAARGGWKGNIEINWDWDNLGDAIVRVPKLDRRSRREYDRQLRKCFVTVSTEDRQASGVTTFDVTGEIPDAVLQINQMGDEEYVKRGFEITSPMTLRLYALVEMPNKTAVDRAWIINAETHERIWETNRRNTDFAGGGSKNRLADEEVDFEVGKYILYYTSDDSHSWDYFNTSPPYDPMNWGVSILAGEGYRASAFKAYEPPDRSNVLLDLTRARDNDYFEKGFKLTRDTKLFVRGFGEYSDWGDEFVDFGGILVAGTGDVVWEMTGRNTSHAGGAEKNRAFEGMIDLPAGKYIAFYSTDGSHSYRDWNSSAPYEPEAWGLAIFPGTGFHKGDFVEVDVEDIINSGDVLARLVRVGDDEHRRARFSLDKTTRIHILAVGEGTGHTMHDYGWIEDRSTGRPVWEMTYRKTRHAGGGEKNRLFDGQITLEPGDYEVFYDSDGSHSFNDWNTSQPRNARQWGITVSIVKP